MKNDTLERLFEDLAGSFDIHETPSRHQNRFLDRLNNVERPSAIKRNWWKPLSIAASIAILLAVGTIFVKSHSTESDLASVSPEMKQTQSFFTTTVNRELQTLKTITNPEAKELGDDALIQIDKLMTEYETLKKDLSESGNDNRVIYAMISNFQNRIDLLQQVIKKIEEIKNLKDHRNETTI
jgi:hypothetical protein